MRPARKRPKAHLTRPGSGCTGRAPHRGWPGHHESRIRSAASASRVPRHRAGQGDRNRACAHRPCDRHRPRYEPGWPARVPVAGCVAAHPSAAAARLVHAWNAGPAPSRLFAPKGRARPRAGARACGVRRCARPSIGGSCLRRQNAMHHGSPRQSARMHAGWQTPGSADPPQGEHPPPAGP